MQQKRNGQGISKEEFNKIKNGIREELGKYLFSETECKPMIITVITEI